MKTISTATINHSILTHCADTPDQNQIINKQIVWPLGISLVISFSHDLYQLFVWADAVLAKQNDPQIETKLCIRKRAIIFSKPKDKRKNEFSEVCAQCSCGRSSNKLKSTVK